MPKAPAVMKAKQGIKSASKEVTKGQAKVPGKAEVIPPSLGQNVGSMRLVASPSESSTPFEATADLLKDIEQSLEKALEKEKDEGEGEGKSLQSLSGCGSWPMKHVQRLVASVGEAAERFALQARGVEEKTKKKDIESAEWSACLGLWPWLFKLNTVIIDTKGLGSSTFRQQDEVAREVALRLTIFLFDSLTLVGGGPAELLSDLGRSAWKMLAMEVQNWGQAAELLDEGRASIVASVLNSFCRAIELGNFNEPGLVHRAIPVLAKCVVLPASAPFLEEDRPCQTKGLAAAANVVIQTILVGGNTQMREDMLEELVNIAPQFVSGPLQSKAKAARGRKPKAGATTSLRPTPYTAALLNLVVASAVCPRARAGQPQKPSREEFEALGEAWALCEESAGRVATALVRRCLLSVSDKDDEQTLATWGRLDGLLKELLQLLSGPSSLSSALLLLTLAKAIARVACAPRSVSLVWTQREFAVKLLGQVAEDISKRCQKPQTQTAPNASAPGNEAQVQELLSKSLPDDFRTVLSKVRESARTDQSSSSSSSCPSRLAIECTILGELQDYETSGATSYRPFFRSCFLLAYYTTTMNQQENAGSQGSKGAKRQRLKKESSSHSSMLGAEEEAITKAWLHLSNFLVGAKVEPKTKGHAKSKYLDCESMLLAVASSLGAGLLHSEGGSLGILARTRLVALEALQAQLRQSSLAFVRRGSLAGLSAAAEADEQLMVSRPFTEALSIALADASPCVRTVAVELLGRMLLSPHESLSTNHVAECRSAVLARMDDAAAAVRRAAFRVTCTTLSLETPHVADIMVNLFRRVKYEAASVRETVLTSLEKCLFGSLHPNSMAVKNPELPQEAFACLGRLAAYPDIGGSALFDLFKAHRQAQPDCSFKASMDSIVRRSLQVVEDLLKWSSDQEGVGKSHQSQHLQQQNQQQQLHSLAAWAQILKQVSAVHPPALQGELPRLLTWVKSALSTDAEAPDLFMAHEACLVLSTIVPSLTLDQKKDQTAQLSKFRSPLLSLLKEQGSGLTRAAAQATCIVAARLGTKEAKEDVQKLANKCMAEVEVWASRRANATPNLHQSFCRTIWTLSTLLEFAEPEPCDSEFPLQETTIKSLAQTLAATVIQGSEALRPTVVPCLSFVLRRHFGLLNQVHPADCSPLEAFKVGLSASTNQALAERTADSLSNLLQGYEKAANAGLEIGDNWGETVAVAMGKPKVCEVVQSLASLQPALLRLLRETVSEPVATSSLAALSSLSRLGVLHMSAAMPDLIATSLAGPSALLPEVKHLLLKLVDHSPSLLLTRLGPGLRIAIQQLDKRISEDQGVTSLLGSRSRCALLIELYATQLEHRRGEKFMDVLLHEFHFATQAKVVGETSSQARAVSELLVRVALLYGAFANFAYRTEADLAKVFVFAARFVQLKVGAFLLSTAALQQGQASTLPPAEDLGHKAEQQDEEEERMMAASEKNNSEGEQEEIQFLTATSLNVPNVVVSVVLNSLCTYLTAHLGNAALERFIQTGSVSDCDGGLEARPLPPHFLRRGPPTEADVRLFSELKALLKAEPVGQSNGSLLQFIRGKIAFDSALLRLGSVLQKKPNSRRENIDGITRGKVAKRNGKQA